MDTYHGWSIFNSLMSFEMIKLNAFLFGKQKTRLENYKNCFQSKLSMKNCKWMDGHLFLFEMFCGLFFGGIQYIQKSTFKPFFEECWLIV